jgi:hypothetical protein
MTKQAVKSDVTDHAASLIRLIDAIDGPQQQQQQQQQRGGYGGSGGGYGGGANANKGWAATYILELFRGTLSSRNRPLVRGGASTIGWL